MASLDTDNDSITATFGEEKMDDEGILEWFDKVQNDWPKLNRILTTRKVLQYKKWDLKYSKIKRTMKKNNTDKKDDISNVALYERGLVLDAERRERRRIEEQERLASEAARDAREAAREAERNRRREAHGSDIAEEYRADNDPERPSQNGRGYKPIISKRMCCERGVYYGRGQGIIEFDKKHLSKRFAELHGKKGTDNGVLMYARRFFSKYKLDHTHYTINKWIEKDTKNSKHFKNEVKKLYLKWVEEIKKDGVYTTR